MKKRSIISGAVVAALVLSSTLGVSMAASADDAVPVEETTEVVEAVETAAEPEAAVSEAQEPAPEPVVEEPVVEEVVEEEPAPAEPAPEPAPAPKPAPKAEKVELSSQPEFICDESGTGWQAKVDTTGDPATVTVTADPGFLIDAYCVKAGTTKHIIQVSPPSASVVIDHPDKDSVSHYQVHVVAIPDEEEPPTNSCVPGEGIHSTNDTDVWSNVDTRADGYVEYVEGGLHVWTTSNTSAAKVSEGMAYNFALKHTGVLDLAWTGTNPPPGINLFVDFDGDGSLDGTLVYESVYGQDLWLTNGSKQFVKDTAPVNGGGNGSQWHGTINQWLTVYPDANVQGIAYSLGSGVLGDGVITSITVNCTVFTFDYVPPVVPEKPEPTVSVEETETVDCETGVVTHIVATTTIDWVWNEQTWMWEETEPTLQVTSTERAVTAEDCPLPEPWSEIISVGDPVLTCDSKEGDHLPIVVTYANYTYAFDEHGQVVETTTLTEEEGVYIVGEDDVEFFLGDECEEPVTPTEPEEPEEEKPTAVPAGSTDKGGLAQTGGGVNPILPIGGLTLLLGGLVAFAMRRRPALVSND